MELKLESGRRILGDTIGINRTFMELKQTCVTIEAQPITGINRTFMELKQNYNVCYNRGRRY